ncbi:DUF2652 domain-containing protein [Flavobacteriaceae bacterium AU392]|nr:DUF2652 domain-containing protein [Flavobacteriaceae bacterium]RKM84843.1 DUF2652 domain-containing protein [Flavobacteriaceae bacterium AU392]
MTEKAILFIPDISGFTEFVHHTDIKHSGHIISELLEILLDKNTIDLKLAEIEGDALFFYKLSESVNFNAIKQQIDEMYIAFHMHLKRYEYERICRCGACSSAYNLSLKFVVHYGEIDFIEVKNTKKPYGSNVIQAHRLLKNEVPITEYALFTENVKQLSKTDSEFSKGIAEYDFGKIVYGYSRLSHLRENLPYVPPIPEDVPKHLLFNISEVIQSPILDLYEVISNFDYRLLWSKGVNKLEYEENKVNRSGRKHKCLIGKNQEIDQTTITRKVNENQLVYGETTDSMPFMKKFNVYYILEPQANGYTKLKIEAYADFKPLGIFFKGIFSKKISKNAAENIKDLVLLIDSGFTTK